MLCRRPSGRFSRCRPGSRAAGVGGFGASISPSSLTPAALALIHAELEDRGASDGQMRPVWHALVANVGEAEAGEMAAKAARNLDKIVRLIYPR